MKVTYSPGTSYMLIVFDYDSVGRLTSERIIKTDPENQGAGYDNYDLTYNFEYPGDELLVKVDNRICSRLKLENGNLAHEALEYRNGRLVCETFRSFFGADPELDGCDECIFNWDGEDVKSISFYKEFRHLGDLRYEYRDEKCNSLLIYAHTYGMIYVPSAFAYECLDNHAALFHTGLLTPTRLIDSYIWPGGRCGSFRYRFDSDGNPETVIFETTSFSGEKYTVTSECKWEQDSFTVKNNIL